MNIWFVSLLLLIISAFALSTGLELSFRLLYLLLFLIVACYFWAWSNIRGIKVKRRLNFTRAQVGDTIEEDFQVSSTSLLPKLWLEVADFSTLPNHIKGRVFGLGSRAVETWVVKTRCSQRGQFVLGPVSISGGDPFGLFRRSLDVFDVFNLLVYPATVDLPKFVFPSGRLSSDGRVRESSRIVTTNASGVREYVQGDGFGSIHWLSTARKSKFMVKEFDREPSNETWLMLDLHREVHFGQLPESTEEYAVTIAASIAKRLLDTGRAVGLVAYGQNEEVILPAKGSPQLMRMLDSLALVKADGYVELQEALAMHSSRIGRNSGIVVITPSLDERWVQGLEHLAQKGVKAAVVLLEPGTFGGSGNSLMIASRLIVEQIPVYSIRQGCDLGEALSLQTNGGH